MYTKIKNFIAEKMKRSKQNQSLKTFDLQALHIDVEYILPFTDRDPIEKTPPKHVTVIKLSIKNNSDLIQDMSYLDFDVCSNSKHKLDFYRYADGLGITLEPKQAAFGYLYVLSEVSEIEYVEYKPLNLKIKVDFNAVS